MSAGRWLSAHYVSSGRHVPTERTNGCLVSFLVSLIRGASYLHEILADDHASSKMDASCVDPHLIGDRRVIRWSKVRQDEQLDPCGLRDPARVLGTRVTGQEMLLEPLGVRGSSHDAIHRR